MVLNNLWGREPCPCASLVICNKQLGCVGQQNYVMWYMYPFERDSEAVPGMENIRYRYRLSFAK
jgi:hypothetical protein